MSLNHFSKSKTMRFLTVLALTASLVITAVSCSSSAPAPSPTPLVYATSAPSRASVTTKDIILSTTTSTRDSGLLDVLIPIFQNQTGYTVKTIAIGTGPAIELARRGEADVVLAHDPAAEVKFVQDGVGINRQLLMHNDFIIVGPPSDPAKIKGSTTAADAFKKIAAANATFVSRNDKSGTSTAELRIWASTPYNVTATPVPSWNISTGQGMGATLSITSQGGKDGVPYYTLSDRATYLAYKKNVQLDILYENSSEPALLNIYHVIQVNPDRFKDINAAGAKAFVDFMISPDTQKLIGQFGVAQYGQPLFFPDYGKKESDLGSV